MVLDGEMTMKTEEGERLVQRGEVVIFPVGPAGAHGFRKDSEGRWFIHEVSERIGPRTVAWATFLSPEQPLRGFRRCVSFSSARQMRASRAP